MGKLTYRHFNSPSEICDFVNKRQVELKSVAVRVLEDHHGIPDIAYIAFYEEKKDGKTN